MTMKPEPRNRFDGSTIKESIMRVPAELAVDAVGLWQVVAAGREGFGLSENDLYDFVRQHIMALLEKGARPVMGSSDKIHFWMVVDYGKTSGEIVDAILTEWQNSGHEPDVGGVWFALPHIYQAKRIDPAEIEFRGHN
jgi:hypothetical protein